MLRKSFFLEQICWTIIREIVVFPKGKNSSSKKSISLENISCFTIANTTMFLRDHNHVLKELDCICPIEHIHIFEGTKSFFKEHGSWFLGEHNHFLVKPFMDESHSKWTLRWVKRFELGIFTLSGIVQLLYQKILFWNSIVIAIFTPIIILVGGNF